MKIENLKCNDYKVVGDTLTLYVAASGTDEVKAELFNKPKIRKQSQWQSQLQ